MKNLFIGIDFSKEKIDATIIIASGLEELSARVSETFCSTTAGYNKLLSWVKKNSNGIEQDSWLFCGEHTGDYSMPLSNYLYGKGYDIWLENAKSIKDASGLRRLKTDRADSMMIAEYAMRNYDRAELYVSLSESLYQLRELFLFRQMLVRQKHGFQVRRAEKNLTLEKCPAKTKMSQIEKHMVNECDKQIAKIEKAIKDILISDEELKHTYELITTVPGIGLQNAICLLVFTNNFKRFDFKSEKDCLLLWYSSFWARIRNQRSFCSSCSLYGKQTIKGNTYASSTGINSILPNIWSILQQTTREGQEETSCS